MSKIEHACHATVYGSGWPADCTRAGVNEEDGGWWCKQHTPSRVQARGRQRDSEWRERKRAEAEVRLTNQRLEAIRIVDAYIRWRASAPEPKADIPAFAEWLYPEVPE